MSATSVEVIVVKKEQRERLVGHYSSLSPWMELIREGETEDFPGEVEFKPTQLQEVETQNQTIDSAILDERS